MRRPRVKREGEWTEIPAANRAIVSRRHCSICGLAYGKLAQVDGKFLVPKQVIHHFLSRRFLESRGIKQIHHCWNLYSICSSDHGRMLAIEDRLFRGDVFGFLQGCKQVGLPVEKIVRFALRVGLDEFSGFTI